MKKKELKVSETEWSLIQVLEESKKRKEMETFQYQYLWNVLKEGGDLITKFGDKFRKLKVKGIRKKVVERLYLGNQGIKENIQ